MEDVERRFRQPSWTEPSPPAEMRQTRTGYETADLAYIHDAGFGFHARAASEELLRALHRAGHEEGVVVDLGRDRDSLENRRRSGLRRPGPRPVRSDAEDRATECPAGAIQARLVRRRAATRLRGRGRCRRGARICVRRTRRADCSPFALRARAGSAPPEGRVPSISRAWARSCGARASKVLRGARLDHLFGDARRPHSGHPGSSPLSSSAARAASTAVERSSMC